MDQLMSGTLSGDGGTSSVSRFLREADGVTHPAERSASSIGK
jgi:hypothetical protein